MGNCQKACTVIEDFENLKTELDQIKKDIKLVEPIVEKVEQQADKVYAKFKTVKDAVDKAENMEKNLKQGIENKVEGAFKSLF